MSIPPILHNDNLIFDDIERANLFNIYFSNNPKLTILTALSFIVYYKITTWVPPFRIVTILLGIEDSAALKIALVISFVINSISSVRKSESQFTRNAKRQI
jgi:hypothetical protein